MTIEIPLTRGMVALIDDEDLPLVAGIGWCAMRAIRGEAWYAVATVDGRPVSMHRRIMGLAPGDGIKCDHRSGDGLNNQRGNLRIATRSQNAANRKTWGASKLRGVSKFGDGRRCWRALIGGTGRPYLGSFETKEEAARAYDAEARIRFGEFACLNFPLPGERSAITGEIMPLQVAA